MSDLLRERFEAWASDKGYLLDPRESPEPFLNGYWNDHTQNAWRGWQAALAAAAPPPDPQKDSGESKKNQQNSGPGVGGEYGQALAEFAADEWADRATQARKALVLVRAFYWTGDVDPEFSEKRLEEVVKEAIGAIPER